MHEPVWQQYFRVQHVHQPETREELIGFQPDFTIINACSEVNDDWEDGLNSEVAIAFDIERQVTDP